MVPPPALQVKGAKFNPQYSPQKKEKKKKKETQIEKRVTTKIKFFKKAVGMQMYAN